MTVQTRHFSPIRTGRNNSGARMRKLDVIELSEDSSGFSKGMRYAVIQRSPYVLGTAVDLFVSEGEVVDFLYEILMGPNSSWVPEVERVRWLRYCRGRPVSCGRCGHCFRTTQKPNMYGWVSCTCGAKIKIKEVEK